MSRAFVSEAAAEANARLRGHPFDLAFLLTLGAQLFRRSLSIQRQLLVSF